MHVAPSLGGQEGASQRNTRTSGNPTDASLALLPRSTLHPHIPLLAPTSTPGVPSNPVSDNLSRLLIRFLTVSNDEHCMIGILTTLFGVKYSAFVRQKGRISTIHSDCNWTDVAQDKFHIFFMIGGKDAPAFGGGNWTCYFVNLAVPLFALIWIVSR